MIDEATLSEWEAFYRNNEFVGAGLLLIAECRHLHHVEMAGAMIAGAVRVYLRGDGTRENMQAALATWDAVKDNLKSESDA